MVPMPSFVSISIRMACGTRPSMIKTRCTPQRMASMQQVTFGSMPPLMTPDSMSCSASAVWMTGVHDEQLADLLARAHAVEQRLRCILLDGSGCAGRGLGLRGGLPAADTHDHEQHRQRREHEQVNGRAPVSP